VLRGIQDASARDRFIRRAEAVQVRARPLLLAYTRINPLHAKTLLGFFPKRRFRRRRRWAPFLREADELLDSSVELHCLDGFVLAALYRLPRPTGDVDYIAAIPSETVTGFEEIAGRGFAHFHVVAQTNRSVADLVQVLKGNSNRFFVIGIEKGAEGFLLRLVFLNHALDLMARS
jgi:hypothetical protein